MKIIFLFSVTGDAYLQKTYTRDFMDKKRKENKGEKKAYYVENSHPAIISKEDFAKVEQELRRRSIKKNKKNKMLNTKYILSDILVCAECGSPYRRVTWSGQYENVRHVWRCDNRLKNGKKFCKKSPTLDEAVIQRAIMDSIFEVAEANNIEAIVLQNKNTIKKETKITNINIEKQNLEKEIEKYKSELDEIIIKELEGGDVQGKYKEISEKIDNVKNQLKKYEELKIDKLDIKITNKLDKMFDESLVRQLIHEVNVVSKEQIEIEFVSAIKVIQQLND